MKKDNKKGITLIALIVTIVVLILLAGVTLQLVLGQNGIITKAGEAKNKFQEASWDEQKQLSQLDDETAALQLNAPKDYILRWNVGESENGYECTNKAMAFLVNDSETGYYDLMILGNGPVISGSYWMPKEHEYWMYDSIQSEYKSKIKKVSVAQGITGLGQLCFMNCSALDTIDIPQSVQQFGFQVFTNTKWLADRKNENIIVTINNILIDGSGYSGELDIPNGITRIGSSAFYNDNAITSVKFPDSLIEIQKSAFEYCTGITSITGGNNIQNIGDQVFNGCSGIQNIDFGDNLERIGKFAFNNCTGMKTFHYSSKLKTIDRAAFQYDRQLQNIDLPEGLEFIGQFAFNHNSGLTCTKIVIPSTVKIIGDSKYPTHMFYDCGKTDTFAEFEVPTSNQYYKSDDGLLYTKDGSVLVSVPPAKTFTDNTYIMPDSVTNLGELCFGLNTHATKVIISDNLIINDDATQEEKNAGFLNYGNSLSLALYTLNGTQLYDVKDTNTRYTSGIRVVGQTGEFGSADNQGYILTKDGKELVAVPDHCIGYQMLPSSVTTIRKNALYTYDRDNNGGFQTKNGMYSGIHFRINKDTTNIDDEMLKYLNWLAKDTTNRSSITLEIQGTNSKYQIVDNQYTLK